MKVMMKEPLPVKINLSFELLQEVRLAHALMELPCGVVLDKKHKLKFQRLQKAFNLNCFFDDNRRHRLLRDIEIVHDLPFTRVGRITKPLIFPHAMFRYLRALWPRQREYQVSFAGLVTKDREKFLENAFAVFEGRRRNNTYKEKQPRSNLLSAILPGGLRGNYYMSGRSKIRIVKSDRGRRYPVKSWDERYWKLLLHSHFVLCPPGDCNWSYRFFEAIICGAIPIIGSHSPLYEGYAYRKIDTDAKELIWSHHLAEKNYRLCRSRLTIPKGELVEEIEFITKRNSL
jgi:hypothetical protein